MLLWVWQYLCPYARAPAVPLSRQSLQSKSVDFSCVLQRARRRQPSTPPCRACWQREPTEVTVTHTHTHTYHTAKAPIGRPWPLGAGAALRVVPVRHVKNPNAANLRVLKGLLTACNCSRCPHTADKIYCLEYRWTLLLCVAAPCVKVAVAHHPLAPKLTRAVDIRAIAA